MLDSEQRRVRLDELGRKRRASGVAVIPLATYLRGSIVGKVPFIFLMEYSVVTRREVGSVLWMILWDSLDSISLRFFGGIKDDLKRSLDGEALVIVQLVKSTKHPSFENVYPA